MKAATASAPKSNQPVITVRLAETAADIDIIGEHACPWCGAPFTPRTDGGSPQTFCSARCWRTFHVACRAWAEDQVRRVWCPWKASSALCTSVDADCVPF